MNTTLTEVGGNDRRQRIIDERVDPGGRGEPGAARLALDGGSLTNSQQLDSTARAVLAAGVEQLADAQELLWKPSQTHRSPRKLRYDPRHLG